MATIPNQTTSTATSYQTSASTKRAPGLTFSRHFTRPGVSPFDEIVWELRDAVIQDFKGKSIFAQKNGRARGEGGLAASNGVASKQLHGAAGTPARETSVGQS